ncbi:hypothetical protein DFH09DRAFT_1288161 [Mycena vulgaris]|nr:hypothetical protein DFH09DRAFT_1288161 [Mycena vulgaris]
MFRFFALLPLLSVAAHTAIARHHNHLVRQAADDCLAPCKALSDSLAGVKTGGLAAICTDDVAANYASCYNCQVQSAELDAQAAQQVLDAYVTGCNTGGHPVGALTITASGGSGAGSAGGASSPASPSSGSSPASTGSFPAVSGGSSAASGASPGATGASVPPPSGQTAGGSSPAGTGSSSAASGGSPAASGASPGATGDSAPPSGQTGGSSRVAAGLMSATSAILFLSFAAL